ncbi:Vps60p/Vps20p-like protein [Cryptosporidium canis]|uniref:Vps60p/Vps20p-like protein n=1 Tax=Cryptosporidium canis TaxID=195482 RepID=A0ABQ8PB18_9CRYT|nr:Vps60p/Vps20p-like protein [Cryptosporidium canis]KAJ1615131.1 Vps60p/Vps20p-like protein [Cryptosporidium canis]
MYLGTHYNFPKVKDIGEWQKLCSSYSFHKQEEYKLDWWSEAIEKLCERNKSILIDINSLKVVAQEEFKCWPIEILCLPNIFKGLVKKKKLVHLNYINNYVMKLWENAGEIDGGQTINKGSKSRFAWINSIIGVFLKNTYSMDDVEIQETDTYVCIPYMDKLSNKLVNDIDSGLLGTISKKMGMDELVILSGKFKEYIIRNFDLCEVSKNALHDISIWYFITYTPGEWMLKPFVVNKGSNSYVNAIKLCKSSSSASKEIRVYDTDVADVMIQITEEDLQKSITNLEEKFLFHDSKCKEYAVTDQKQLAINHLKQKHQIEKALTEVNEQLLLLSQSKVSLDTSNARVSLLNALETSTKITRDIFNENEILKKLEGINLIREEVEVTQETINSMIQSCIKDGPKDESLPDLEKELNEIMHRVNISAPKTEQINQSKVPQPEPNIEKYKVTDMI